jgi:hypothetical protein
MEKTWTLASLIASCRSEAIAVVLDLVEPFVVTGKLTAMGKDERALSVSGYVYRGNVKYTEYAFNKTTVYKRKSRNHLGDQIESFRIGDKE